MWVDRKEYEDLVRTRGFYIDKASKLERENYDLRKELKSEKRQLEETEKRRDQTFAQLQKYMDMHSAAVLDANKLRKELRIVSLRHATKVIVWDADKRLIGAGKIISFLESGSDKFAVVDLIENGERKEVTVPFSFVEPVTDEVKR